jgi:hypothetical protein
MNDIVLHRDKTIEYGWFATKECGQKCLYVRIRGNLHLNIPSTNDSNNVISQLSLDLD